MSNKPKRLKVPKELRHEYNVHPTKGYQRKPKSERAKKP